MKILKRFFRHNWFTHYRARQYFPHILLQNIEKNIAVGEELHRAQVCVIIEHVLPWHIICSGVSSRVRAQQLFAQYHVWDTKENSGVLLYINVADRKIEIVTDRGVDDYVATDVWKRVCEHMASAFKNKQYEAGVLSALDEIQAILKQYFPRENDDGTQLCNKPIVIN